MLVHVPTDLVCPSCGGDVHSLTWAQPALLFHGGYGETTRVVIRACRACDWQLCAETGAVRP